MIFFLLDLLIIALFLAGRHHSPEVGSSRPIDRLDKPTDPPVNTPRQQPPGGWAAGLPQWRTVSPSPQHSVHGRARSGELTITDIPVWTPLDDHQLTRLLKESSS